MKKAQRQRRALAELSCFKAFCTVGQQFLQGDRLSRNRGPEARCLDRRAMVPCRTSPPACSGAPACHSLSSGNTVRIRHPDISRTRSGRSSRAPGGRLSRFRPAARRALVDQDFRQQFADTHFVVDTRMMAIWLPPGAAGGCQVQSILPPSGCRLLIARYLPWCSSTIFLTMGRPSPVPRALVVT